MTEGNGIRVLEDYTNTILLQNSRFLLVLENYKKPFFMGGDIFSQKLFPINKRDCTPYFGQNDICKGGYGGEGGPPHPYEGVWGEVTNILLTYPPPL
jgi:hypothetical protein